MSAIEPGGPRHPVQERNWQRGLTHLDLAIHSVLPMAIDYINKGHEEEIAEMIERPLEQLREIQRRIQDGEL